MRSTFPPVVAGVEQMTRLEEILYHLDRWNELNSSAKHRNELRHLLGWKDGGRYNLSELLVDAINEKSERNGKRDNGNVTSPNRDDPPFDVAPPKTRVKSLEEVEGMIRGMYDGKVTSGEVAEFILFSGWNYKGDRLTKPAFEVQDFLEERAREGDAWDFSSDGVKRFYKVICNVFRAWYEKQYAR